MLAAVLLLLAISLAAQESKTILGPANQPLHDGAQALMARDADEGVRLTLLGLQQARNADERNTARANLCAGYALLEQYAVALAYCDEVLAEDERNWRALSNRALIYIKLQRFAEADSDLTRGEAIDANGRNPARGAPHVPRCDQPGVAEYHHRRSAYGARRQRRCR